MKIFTILFVLINGLSAIGSATAQEPTPTPIMVRLSVSRELAPTTTVRLGSEQDLKFGFYIFLDSYNTSAKDVILTASLPASLTFVSATASGSVTLGAGCSHANGIVTCNLRTIPRYYPDYSAIVRIYVRPEIAGPVTIIGKIKGSNANESTFSQTETVSPLKSRKRVRLF